MERLPEDMAVERYHNDIVKLLREHHPRSPQLQPLPHAPPASAVPHQNPLQSSSHPIIQPQVVHRTHTAPRSKAKRPKSQVMGPPQGASDVAADSAAVKRSSSVKKKRDPPPPPTSLDMQLSLDNPHLVFKTANPVNPMFSGPRSMPQFSELPPAKQPPPYDDCVKPTTSLASIQPATVEQFNYVQLMNSGPQALSVPQNQQEQQQILQPQNQIVHQRQQSMPASFNSSANQSPQQLQQNHLSPPPPRGSHSAHTSPQSHHPYPPQSNSASPNKLRPPLPTSPTHLAALRMATVSSGYEFPVVSTGPTIVQQANEQIRQQQQQQQQQVMNQRQLQQQQRLPTHHQAQQQQPQQQSQAQQGSTSYYPHYPTPPSHHSGVDATPQHALNTNSHDSFPTPSPESPGQWSSGSPHSHSDWSEGVRSPPISQLTMGQKQVYQQSNNMIQSPQTLGLPIIPLQQQPQQQQPTTQNSIYI